MSIATTGRKAKYNISSCPTANRMDRLKAALIDSGIMLAANFPLYLMLWFLGVFNYYLVALVICAAASATIFMSMNYNLSLIHI